MAKQKTILLVEDDEQLNRSLTRILETAGYRVIATRDGEKAMDLVQNNRIDLLVSDMMLPGVAGTTVADIQRDLDPECKILLISGMIESGTVSDYPLLEKPFDRLEFLETVRKLLR